LRRASHVQERIRRGAHWKGASRGDLISGP
jgi:hypothetical protein